MPEPSHFQPVDDLLGESVSDGELRIILDRLGHEEFGGDPATTVQDIVEGTGADPIVIGRILADVRKEEFEKRFGLQLEEHEKRIDEHETRIEKIEKEEREPPVTVINQTFVNSPTPIRRALHEEKNTFFEGFDEPKPKQHSSLFEVEHEDYEELKAIAEERRRQRQMLPLALIALAIFIIIVFASKSCSGPASSMESGPRIGFGGVEVTRDRSGNYTTVKNGVERPSTGSEMAKYLGIEEASRGSSDSAHMARTLQ